MIKFTRKFQFIVDLYFNQKNAIYNTIAKGQYPLNYYSLINELESKSFIKINNVKDKRLKKVSFTVRGMRLVMILKNLKRAIK